MDTTRAMSYPESISLYNDFYGFGDRVSNISVHLKHFYTNSSVKNVWKSFSDFTDPTKESGKKFINSMLLFEFYTNEGMKKTKKDETVYPSRDQMIYTVIAGARWKDDTDDKEAFKWLNQTREMFFDDTTKDDLMLSNCSAPAVEDMERIMKPENVYGKENMEKLKELKRKYDPTCFFNKWIPIKV